jgi:hypothetical protein
MKVITLALKKGHSFWTIENLFAKKVEFMSVGISLHCRHSIADNEQGFPSYFLLPQIVNTEIFAYKSVFAILKVNLLSK